MAQGIAGWRVEVNSVYCPRNSLSPELRCPRNFAENVCYLQDLYTDPAVRGRGVARALIEAVYAAADAEGCPSVYWLTQEFNYRGRMLYDQVAVKTPFIRYNR
jgi:GNAT superfamily N-acetyltransferase